MAQYDDTLDPRDPEIEYADEKRPLREGYYGTGSTEPPKDHMDIIAVVLVLLISFSSLISALGLMNIQVFQVSETSEPPTHLNLLETCPEGVDLSGDPCLERRDPEATVENPVTQSLEGISTQLQLQSAPQGIENIDETPGALSWQAVYEKVMPSVVSITTCKEDGAATGTGVIMDSDGYIITNAHVVDDGASIQVLLTDGRTLEARCVGADSQADLAVLRVDAADLIPAEFGDSSTLRVGDSVVAIGDPLGAELRGTMTNGIISGINRDIRVGRRTMTLLQTTAALNPGNSGGPLVNCYGQVVGINTMKVGDYNSENGVEGIGFAIPMVTVRSVVEQLSSHSYAEDQPDIGFQGETVPLFSQVYYEIPAGLRITALSSGSSAARQGIRPGDVLLTLNGSPTTSMDDVEQILADCAVGDEVTAVFYRSGTEHTVTITLEAEEK